MDPFRIDIPEATLDDLRERLRRTRWPDEIEGAGWDYGVSLGYLRELAAYWADGFDWRTVEARLNGFHHFKTDGIHFVHERGKGPRPFPLLLVHGWPDSFARFERLIPLLTHPDDPADAFDVVAPSLPGFGFSDKPKERGWTPGKIAGRFAELMNGLGYERYGTHGGDWGSSITETLARAQPESVVGLHLTDIPFRRLFSIPPDDLSEGEKAYLQKGQAWSSTQGGYAIVQGNEPQTLAYGLTDSPVGLAAWFVDKFQRWTDRHGGDAPALDRDAILTDLTIYWATETAASASRIYFETAHDPAGSPAGRIDVPMGAAIFPKDLIPAPREFAERIYDVRRWTEMPQGGHFAALEEPEALAHEIREFFRPLRSEAPQSEAPQ